MEDWTLTFSSSSVMVLITVTTRESCLFFSCFLEKSYSWFYNVVKTVMVTTPYAHCVNNGVTIVQSCHFFLFSREGLVKPVAVGLFIRHRMF